MWKRQRDEEYYLKYYRVFHGYYHNLGNIDVAYRYLDSLSSLSNETDLRYNKMTAKVAEDRLKIQQYLRSEEHTSELQSLMRISYAVFCLIKKKTQYTNNTIHR